MEWIRKIEKLGACTQAVEWGKQFETIEEAWQTCERGDWMLWLLGKLADEPESSSRKKLVLTACQCARLTLPLVKKGETRPLKAIETTEAWAKGEGGVTLQDVKNAAYAAYAAAYAATHAATHAAYAAAYAADAVAYATHAAYAAAYAATHAATLRECADIVRGNHSVPKI